MKRAALLITIVALASLGLAVPVLAAAPGSDVYAGRTVIGAIPFADSIDTTEATTDADDTEANAGCGAPATDASVWYEITATTDDGLMVDTTASDYASGIIVATGAPGGLVVVTCGGGAVSFGTTTGETYAILVFDYQGDGGGNGGTLDIAVGELPPPPVLDMTIASAGSFNAKTGSATIRGTVTCDPGGAEFTKQYAYIQVSQFVGRFRISGEGYADFDCDGATHTWAAEVFGSGKFAGGKASVSMYAFVCNSSGCDEVQAQATVTLKK